MLVCGPRKVGKSTFSTWLVNHLLCENFLQVAYLNLDPGQTEFTSPGCLSLHLLSRPLLGPSFTHIIEPVKSFFLGSLSPGDNPYLYLDLCNQLYNFYLQNFLTLSIPLIINTAGWIEGLGALLLKHMVENFSLDYVFCIQENPERLLKTLEEKSHSINGIKSPFALPVARPRWISVNSGLASAVRQPRPVQLRSLNFFSYFFGQKFRLLNEGGLIQFEKDQLAIHVYRKLSHWPAYGVNWKSLWICQMYDPVPNHLLMNSLNFSLVALYFQKNPLKKVEQHIFHVIHPKQLNYQELEYVGIAFIRSISMKKRQFMMVTPVSYENIKRVNLIVKGRIELPKELLADENNMPYSSSSHAQNLCGVDAVKKNTYIPKRKKNESANM